MPALDSLEGILRLRENLRPQGSVNVTTLRLKPGCAVDADLVQKAIDECVRHYKLFSHLGEEETACMKLAKIVLLDSAYL